MQSLENFKRINASELRSFLTGLILGDGTIDKGTNKRSFKIKSINRNFINYIEYVIKNNTCFRYYINEFPEIIDKYNVRHQKYWQFVITSHPYFNKLYHYFYDDYRHRTVYTKTLNWLTPIGLANWYMSDGYICLVGKNTGNIYNRRLDICTDRYKLEDIQKIQNFLQDKFGIKTSINKRGKFYRIRICMESYETFITLIQPYIVPSMLYKLYLGYNNKQRWMSNDFWNFQEYLKSAVTLPSNVEG